MYPLNLAEYIWLDGNEPVRELRSKARVIHFEYDNISIDDFPEWSFDGSSTKQAVGDDSDCILKPMNFVTDPMRGDGNYLVLCEVMNPNGTPHESNSRAQLREILDAGAAKSDPWIGYEQEYTLFQGHKPAGWPDHGFPAPQGPYYCGVGADRVFGRDFAEAHAQSCMDAGILIYGINAEVMAGQWEFQIGYRDIEAEDAGVLNASDHLWFARFLMHRIGEMFGYQVSIDNKPIKGDWNGAGLHTNFSTKETRHPKTGLKAINDAVSRLGKKHAEHIALYGDKLGERLTGLHETCDINEFKSGEADRGCSIRIPKPVALKGCGYFEDRRPGANSDPYLVAARLCTTVCNIDEKLMTFTAWPKVA